jgi:alpha,alpha-trehalose phosphorylase
MSPLVGEQHSSHGLRATLTHRTRASGLLVSVSMDHVVEGPDGTVTASESEEDMARVTVTTELKPGTPLRIVKVLSYGWSSRRSLPALRDQVHASLSSGMRTGWDGLRKMQRSYLDRFWENADVELEGDAPLQQAVRFGLFHVLQAGARGQRRAIPAKGLTGTGYDGHTFWDTEMYVLPPLTYTAPQAAADALRWRHETLDVARANARELNKAGAAFPWRTIHGEECSGYWPAGTAAFHINADIADAVRRQHWATGDDDFMQEVGLELLIETARFWRSLGHHDPGGGFRIDGVTGPDEYSAIADNNLFTNLMAARNLRVAADMAGRWGELAATFGVDNEEIAEWRDAAAAIVIPYNHELQVHEQAENFTRHERWDFESTGDDQYPLLLNFPYYDLYRKQVVKQADLVMALYLHGNRFDAKQKARDFEYYEALTVRDSSLSAAIQAIVAAETGHIELAHDLFGEAALVDLRDLKHNTDDGLHIASLAGGWLVAVAGFGGLRDHDDTLSFAPRLPQRLGRLEFRLGFRGRRLSVGVTRRQARYTLLDGEPLELLHHGERFELSAGEPETRPIPPALDRPPVLHPKGRAPARRHPAS